MIGRAIIFSSCLASSSAQGPGSQECPCLTQNDPTPPGLDKYFAEDVWKAWHDGIQQYVEYSHPDYGFSGCGVHDDFFGNPHCPSPGQQGYNNRPPWCDSQWCFVDPNNCVLPYQAHKSTYFSEAQIYYSYRTCGIENFFARDAIVNDMSAEQIFYHVTGLVRNLQTNIGNKIDYAGDFDRTGCPRDDQHACRCDSCEYIPEWQLSVNHNHINGLGTKAAVKELNCAADPMSNFFSDITREVYSDPKRIAYVYYGHQESGAMIQWPASEDDDCDAAESFDARFRPWYVAAATGPKDVVLVLDASGSMNNQGRWDLMTKGVEQVLKTLTEYDYVGVVLFHSDWTAYNNDLNLYKVSANTRTRIMNWLQMEGPWGSTSFTDGFQSAFEMLSNARSTKFMNGSAKRTADCESIILFMTDGQDTSNMYELMQNDNWLQGLQDEFQVISDGKSVRIFTYAFGSDAQITLPQIIACQHNGIFRQVDDGSDLGLVMSEYYKLYITETQMFNDYVRFTEYQDYSTGTTLISSCMAVRRQDGQEHNEGWMRGVVCVDLNTMISVDDLKDKPDFSTFKERMNEDSRFCPHHSHEQIAPMLNALRSEAEPERAQFGVFRNGVCDDIDDLKRKLDNNDDDNNQPTNPNKCAPAVIAQDPCHDWRDCSGLGSRNFPLRQCYVSTSNAFGRYDEDVEFALPMHVDVHGFKARDHPAIMVQQSDQRCSQTSPPHVGVWYQCDYDPNNFYPAWFSKDNCKQHACVKIDDIILITDQDVIDIMGYNNFYQIEDDASTNPVDEDGSMRIIIIAAAGGGGAIVLIMVIWCICQSNNCKSRPSGNNNSTNKRGAVNNNAPPAAVPISQGVVQAVPISQEPVAGYNARASYGNASELPEGDSVFGQVDYTRGQDSGGLYMPRVDNVVQASSVTKI